MLGSEPRERATWSIGRTEPLVQRRTVSVSAGADQAPINVRCAWLSHALTHERGHARENVRVLVARVGRLGASAAQVAPPPPHDRAPHGQEESTSQVRPQHREHADDRSPRRRGDRRSARCGRGPGRGAGSQESGPQEGRQEGDQEGGRQARRGLEDPKVGRKKAAKKATKKAGKKAGKKRGAKKAAKKAGKKAGKKRGAKKGAKRA